MVGDGTEGLEVGDDAAEAFATGGEFAADGAFAVDEALRPGGGGDGLSGGGGADELAPEPLGFINPVLPALEAAAGTL